MRILKKEFDIYVIVPTICLCLWGLFHLYTISLEDSYYYFERQAIWLCFGIFFLFLFSFFPKEVWSRLSYLVYTATVFFLVLVIVKGSAIYGAKRWLDIGFFNFQPSELAKLSLILALSKILSGKERIGWKNILLSFILASLFFFLIAVQPDLGTALIVFSLWLILLFLSGISLKSFFVLIGTILASLPIFYLFLRPYQKLRILTYLNLHKDPLGAGWSSLQSKIAIGSGRIFGKGIGGAAHTKLKYLPQPLTDFIFSSIGEEWGFIGVSLLIVAYVMIILRGLSFALREGKSFSGLFAAGFVTLIAVQAFINMGMASGIIPVTGVPLPFVSYGGSSLLVFLSGTGILLSLSREEL